MKKDMFICFHYSSVEVINASSKYSYQLNLENIYPAASRNVLTFKKRKFSTDATIKIEVSRNFPLVRIPYNKWFGNNTVLGFLYQ